MSKLKQKEINIAIIGLGYVGLPLAVEFSKHYPVTGFDLDENRIKELKDGFDRTNEVSKTDLLDAGNLALSSSKNAIKDANVYIVTVPTPVDKNNTPDLNPLKSASEIAGKFLDKGNVVIYESTVYPGATEEICVPILEKESGLKYNAEFSCGYSPERINPGDKEHSLTAITKVTSGSNEKTAEFVDTLYSSIIPAGTFQASSIVVAEAAKVIENTQRDVNIALINELSLIFNKLNLDTVEVLETAGTKWNFLPFRPGLVGGHCIGVDPYYLTHRAVEVGYHPEMILAGRSINDTMGQFIAENTINELAEQGINPINAKIAVFGLTFKENCPDLRNTKVTDILDYLKSNKCQVVVTDEWANLDEVKKEYGLDLVDLDSIQGYDAAILAVGHDAYTNFTTDDWQRMLTEDGVVIDVKSLYDKDTFSGTSIKHWRL